MTQPKPTMEEIEQWELRLASQGDGQSTRSRECIHILLARVRELEETSEQLTVQLAGCGVAALGIGTDQIAKKDDYGWSQSYQDVLDLRTQLAAAQEDSRRLDWWFKNFHKHVFQSRGNGVWEVLKPDGDRSAVAGWLYFKDPRVGLDAAREASEEEEDAS